MPQLSETNFAPSALARATPANMSLLPAVFASISVMSQFGQTADTMSTSSDISPAQPVLPAGSGRGGAQLVELAEAAVGRRAGRQAVPRAVDREVGLGVGVVEGVDDVDGLAHPGGRGRQAVRRGQVGRAVPARRHQRPDRPGPRLGLGREVGAPFGLAGHLAGRHVLAAGVDGPHGAVRMRWGQPAGARGRVGARSRERSGLEPGQAGGQGRAQPSARRRSAGAGVVLPGA